MLFRMCSPLLSPLALSSTIRRFARSPVPCKSLLSTCVPPQARRRPHATKASPDAPTDVNPRLVAEGDIRLSASQVKDLFAGRFPTDCDRDVLVLKDLSQRDFKSIVHGFERSLCRRKGRPSGYLVFGDSFHTTSILRAPPTNVHEALVWNIGNLVLNALEQATAGQDGSSFQVMMNTSARSNTKFTMKVPDVRIERYEPAPTSGPITLAKTVFIAEIGFTESSSALEKSIKEWFSAMPDVHIAFLVKLDERPRFNSERAFSCLPAHVIANPEEYINCDIKPSLNQGAIEIYGVNFVGKMTAYLEVWRRGCDGVEAARSGERIAFYDSSKALDKPKLEIDLAAFGFLPDHLQDEKLVLDCGGWDAKLRTQSGELAYKRLCSTLKKHCTTEEKGAK
ncbi:hypothetical protein MaudCBS49596_003096 [Microsporum audouinii]